MHLAFKWLLIFQMHEAAPFITFGSSRISLNVGVRIGKGMPSIALNASSSTTSRPSKLSLILSLI